MKENFPNDIFYIDEKRWSNGNVQYEIEIEDFCKVCVSNDAELEKLKHRLVYEKSNLPWCEKCKNYINGYCIIQNLPYLFYDILKAMTYDIRKFDTEGASNYFDFIIVDNIPGQVRVKVNGLDCAKNCKQYEEREVNEK